MAAADRPVGRAALAAAIVLHLAVFAALTFSPKPTVVPTGAAVPITVVSSEPPAAPAKAEPAPVAEAAQTETPTPKAPPPQPAPPPPPAKPQPRPSPPRPPRPTPTKPLPAPLPKVKTKPEPKPSPPSPPAPAKPTRAARSSAVASLDLDALQLSLAKSTHSAPPRPSFAARGPTRTQSAPRTATAAGVSQADQVGLSQLLNRLWNPNCSVEGGDAVLVSLAFTVGSDGRLVGRVNAAGRESSPDPVVAAAARRAIDAVHAVEPYPAVYRGSAFRINFNAKMACANR